jgi:hypothetical protein
LIAVTVAVLSMRIGCHAPKLSNAQSIMSRAFPTIVSRYGIPLADGLCGIFQRLSDFRLLRRHLADMPI